MLVDGLGWIVLLLVGGALALGFRQQFASLSPRERVLERLGLTPQWKFFGQQAIDRRDWVFEDLHLLVRHGGATVGPWQQVPLRSPRGWRAMLWWPQSQLGGMVGEAMEKLAVAEERRPLHLIPDCVPYLLVLRAALDAVAPQEGQAIQFAVASCTGHRRPRTMTLRFLSAWHQP